ncbi:phage major capsid protein [Gracilibacillus sp. D59]|uniref:phage major capsid protein n=1 Tax=Gracilibacillus sp. D59 TaxID=3457434 RepID=UPI003FCC3B17
MGNQDILQRIEGAIKSLTTSDIGSSVLARQKQQRFVRVVSEATTILDNARRIIMQSHTYDIDRIGFASRILQKATEGQDPSGDPKPQTNTNTLESKEVIAVPSVTDSTMEDNIEEEGFEDTLLDLIADRTGIDLEELFMQGDTTSTDTFLAITDGWLKKSANQVTGASDGTGDFDSVDVEDMFDAMLGAIPKKYLRNRSEWTFYTHWDIEDDYRNVLRQRGTGLGDSAQTDAIALAYKGISVQNSPNVPAGQALLVPNNNLVYGIYRDIRIEQDRRAKARTTDFVTTLRVDCHYEDENASVVGTGYTGA